MLSWVVDNAFYVVLLLALIAAAVGAVWWRTRYRGWLIATVTTLALIGVVVVLSFVVDTDRKKLVRNVETMRDEFNAGKLDDALKHFANEVSVATAMGTIKVNKSDLKMMAQGNMSAYGMTVNKTKVIVSKIDVEEINGPKATVTFFVRPEDDSAFGKCQMGFVRDDKGQWLVDYFHLESAIGGKKGPLIFPFGGGGGGK